jgi:hypothetical protein
MASRFGIENIPRGLELRVYATFAAQLNSFVKKSLKFYQSREKHTSGPKGRIDYSRFSPGMNPRPTERKASVYHPEDFFT